MIGAPTLFFTEEDGVTAAEFQRDVRVATIPTPSLFSQNSAPNFFVSEPNGKDFPASSSAPGVAPENLDGFFMRRICCVCGVEFGRKPCAPEFHDTETHGFCPICYAFKWTEMLEALP